MDKWKTQAPKKDLAQIKWAEAGKRLDWHRNEIVKLFPGKSD